MGRSIQASGAAKAGCERTVVMPAMARGGREPVLIRKVLVLAVGLAGLVSLGGCAATSMALAHKDLDVQSYTDGVLILPESADKTYSLSVRNSTRVPLDEAAIQAGIERKMQAKGYTEVAPEKAHYLIQLVTYTASTDAAAAGVGNNGGILAGAAAGGINGNGQAALIGGLVGGVADTVAGGLVKDVTVTVDSEIQVGVRQPRAVQTAQKATLQQGDSTVETQQVASVGDIVDYRVKVITTADQTNLKLADAIPQMNRGLIRNVAGLF